MFELSQLDDAGFGEGGLRLAAAYSKDYTGCSSGPWQEMEGPDGRGCDADAR